MLQKTYHYLFSKKKGWSLLFLILKFLVFIFLLILSLSVVIFVYYAKDLPRPESFTERSLAQSTKIYDRTGQVLLYEIYGEEKRTYVPLEKIPLYLQQAIIAVEDKNFYHHPGVDLNGVLRSILINLKVGQLIYGGSTIPQQLIRSTFLTPEKTLERKIREIILSLELNRRYSKNQILEWYLNQIPFGQNAYGVEAASQVYFNKSVTDISLAEAATLAALIRAPYYYSPYGEQRNELLKRKDYVLQRMYEDNYLTEEQLKTGQQEIVEFAPLKTIKAPHFVLYVIENELKKSYGEDLEYLKQNGLKIYTTLDWRLQQLAEKTVKEKVEQNRKIFMAYNGALVAIKPNTGEILAMVGSADWYATSSYPENCLPGHTCLFDPKFNMAVGSKQNPGRQPGSAFKPFIYATAFKKGYTDDFRVLDDFSNFGTWGNKEYLPQNYDGLFHGLVTLRQALAQSLNIPSIKVLYLIGLEEKINNELAINNFHGLESIFVKGLAESIKTAQDMGITTLNQPISNYGPSLVLGGGEVKLLDMTSAYGVFATNGLKIPPVSILKIEDYNGKTIEITKKTPQRVLSSEICQLITSILSDNEARAPMFGPRSYLYFEGYQVAVKTGTTNDFRDGWEFGYTPDIVVGAWVGNNNNAPMTSDPAARIVGPIFYEFMSKYLTGNY
ncbi:MAG: transglycosylase domain-containing protein [Minisyncoccales bacterium]